MFVPKIAIMALAAAHLFAPAQAQPLRTFSEIEFRSDPVALIGEVRSDLAAHIPAGTPLADARELLSAAGARCRPAKISAVVRCRFETTRFEGDTVAVVRWTIDLAIMGETVTSFAVERFPAR